jgi:hypothetical protein
MQLSENKRVKKPIVVFALFIASFSAFAQAPSPSASSNSGGSSTPATPAQKIDSEKEQLIRDVLARTKEVEQAQERIGQALVGMRQMMSRLPEKYWEKYRSMISENDLRNRLVHVYDKLYSVDELRSMLQFFDTPAGKKMTENAVPILRESMAIAQEMSRQAGTAVMSEVNADQLLQNPVSVGSFKGTLLAPGASTTPSAATPAPSTTP